MGNVYCRVSSCTPQYSRDEGATVYLNARMSTTHSPSTAKQSKVIDATSQATELKE